LRASPARSWRDEEGGCAIRRAAEIKPKFFVPHFGLAAALAKLGRLMKRNLLRRRDWRSIDFHRLPLRIRAR